MEVNKIVAEIDQQIARLKRARQLLSSSETTVAKKRGRPPAQVVVKPTRRRRQLTAEGRKRISEALKRRWALRRKTAAKQAKDA